MAMLNNQRVILTGLRWFKMVFWCFDVQLPRNQVLLHLAFVMRCNKWPRCYVVHFCRLELWCNGARFIRGFPVQPQERQRRGFYSKRTMIPFAGRVCQSLLPILIRDIQKQCTRPIFTSLFRIWPRCVLIQWGSDPGWRFRTCPKLARAGLQPGWDSGCGSVSWEISHSLAGRWEKLGEVCGILAMRHFGHGGNSEVMELPQVLIQNSVVSDSGKINALGYPYFRTPIWGLEYYIPSGYLT
jgi:hypothetical protein